MREPDADRQQKHEPQQEYHPRSVSSFCKPPEQSQRVRSERDRNQRGCRPAEEARERIGKQTPCPPEASRDVSALEHRNTLHRERSGQKQREQKENYSRQLAL